MGDRGILFLEDLIKSISSRDPVHGWEHIARVRALCRVIASRVGGADLEVLDLAALLHDVGRFIDGSGHHVEASIAFAKKILGVLGYDEQIVSRVIDAIAGHSYSYGYEPKTLEGKILSDADKIDAIGAIGVARSFMLGGIWGRSIGDTIKHFEEKLLKLYDRLYLEESRRLAAERAEFLKSFYRQLQEELGVNS